MSNFADTNWDYLLGFYEENNKTNLLRLVSKHAFLEKV